MPQMKEKRIEKMKDKNNIRIDCWRHLLSIKDFFRDMIK